MAVKPEPALQVKCRLLELEAVDEILRIAFEEGGTEGRIAALAWLTGSKGPQVSLPFVIPGKLRITGTHS